MIAMLARHTRPPRLVVRTTLAMFAVVAFVLSAVLLLIGIQGNRYVRGTVADKLAAGQRMLSALEQRQSRELQAQVVMLAENPTLKAAIDTHASESRLRSVDSAAASARQARIRSEDSSGAPAPHAAPRSLHPLAASARLELVATIQRELEKLADRIQPDVLAVSDLSGTVLAAAGRHQADWPKSLPPVQSRQLPEQFVTLPSGVYQRVAAPIRIQDVDLGEDVDLGVLELATALDQEYASRLSKLSGAKTLVVADARVVATTLPADAASALTPQVLQALSGSSTVSLGGAEYAVQLLFTPGAAAVYALDSIDASTAPILSGAMSAMFWLALAAFSLAGVASLWMARTLSRPINTLSRSLAEMTQSRTFDDDLPATGSSLEVDALTRSFNTMMQSVSSAQAETRSAYVGAIRALAVALDARDPYTAGHSERVSAIAVALGREMALSADDLDVLRLGALLHDIGKIGISDAVLRKPDALTAEEYEMIKEHPGLGARIMRSVPFLAPHLPIVELHHERPDGRGYPYGLTSEQTPLLARIVHVADAFDAITSARAYRPARPSSEAVRELWRHAGTQFDAEVVQALLRALPAIGAVDVSAQSDVDVAVFVATRHLALVTRG
jgi:putative nucleotidyltransferase with HDIG domain